MQDVIRTLTESIGTGELINIIYHGGSEPGAARMIQPIALKGEKIRARCYKTNTVKEFLISKIALAGDDIPAYTGTRKNPDYDVLDGIASIDDILAKFKAEIESLGWVIIHDASRVGLFKRYKNGKVYVRPSLFIESDHDLVFCPRT